MTRRWWERAGDWVFGVVLATVLLVVLAGMLADIHDWRAKRKVTEEHRERILASMTCLTESEVVLARESFGWSTRVVTDLLLLDDRRRARGTC